MLINKNIICIFFFSSPFKINLNLLLPEAFPVLASFLRKNQRALKLSTLILLDTLVKNYSEFHLIVIISFNSNNSI